MTHPSDMFARAEAAAKSLRDEGAEQVFLFGSLADGAAADCSDIDLAVVGLAPHRFCFAMAKASDAAGCTIDLIDLDHDTPFVNVLREHGRLRRVA